jgi:hypothetical protein
MPKSPGRLGDEPRALPPVSSRGRWIGWGFVVQVIGIAVPAAYLSVNAHRMSVTADITAASFRLAWRSDAHTGTGLALLMIGAATFAIGSTLMARPFVRRRVTLLIAVPLAALLGVLVLGVLALVVAAVVGGALDWLDTFDVPSGGGRKGRKGTQNIPSGAN